MNSLGIFGSSGVAREIAIMAEEQGYKSVYFIDKNAGVEKISGLKIIAEDEIKSIEDGDFIIGIGDGKIRRKIASEFSNLNYINLIHPSVTIGKKESKKLQNLVGNIFYAGVRISTNTILGNFGLFNLNATIAHDCIVENFVTVSPGANISGNVFLGECSYIGAGATILQGKSLNDKLTIGAESTVGAGAVVVRTVTPRKIVKGIPAK